MIRNYWNITCRNLFKHKSYTLLNVFGLVTAIASSILIIQYARHELTYDAFHVNADRIQLVYKERNTAQGIQELDDTWVPLLDVMREEFPGIAGGARLFRAGGQWLETGGARFNDPVTYADPALLEIFSFPLAAGDPVSALDGRNSMVLSREMAAKYFGDENPLGKTVTLNFRNDYLVTGVLEDIPQNASLRPDILVPFESIRPAEELEAMNANWGSSFLETYLLLAEGQTEESLEAQFPRLVFNVFGEEGANGTNNMKLKLWPLRSLYDRATGSNATSRVLLGIAFSIILIACVNFMNLSLARSLERAREVGVRKTLGGLRGELLRQFLGESLAVSLVSVVLGLGLASLLLPLFNGLYGLELSLNPLTDFSLLALLVVVCLLAAVLSGGYPALMLSRFKAVESLKGKLKSSPGGIRLRNILTFLQFGLAIMLATGVIVVWQQIRFMKTQDLNFEAEQVLVLPVRLRDFADTEAAASRMETFRNEVLRIAGVTGVAFSMSVPGDYQNSNVFARPEDWQSEQPLRMLIAVTDASYFDVYGMDFLEGGNFSGELASEGGNAVILNETAMRDMGWSSAVGKRVNDWTVAGVVEDFHYQSLESEIRPIIHLYGLREHAAHNFVSIKLDTADLQPVLAQLERLWRELDPSRSFDYYFIEDRFASLYGGVENVSRVVGYFSLLSIIIANLGLLGLASYSVVQRSKEIGVRKVFGARVAQIVLLLSRQFLKPVILANLIAWPVAYIAVNRWLQGFAYHIDVNWIIFPLAGLCVLWLALATVAGHSVKAANTHPVLALRYE